MRARGYSLLETLIVISLTGMMSYIAMFAFRETTHRFKLNKSAWEMVSLLNQARFRSVWSGRNCRVRVEDNTVYLEKFEADRGQWINFRTFKPEGVTVTANNWPVFHPQGTVSNLATIIVANSRGSYRITVAITGRIKTTRVA